MTLDALKLIVVPTDFSEPSAVALRAAVRLAQAFDVPIEMLHVDVAEKVVEHAPCAVLVVPVTPDV